MENEEHTLVGSKLVKVAIYARVSGPNQGVPEAQVEALEKYAAFKEYTIVERYIDTITGDVEKRLRANKTCRRDDLMRDAESKLFEGVLVWKYDRFARSVLDLCQSLETFKRLGIAFVSTTEGIDTTTTVGAMMFHMLAGFAEFERKVIAERCLAGLRRVQETGLDRFGKPVSLGCRTRLGKPVATDMQREMVITAYKRKNTFSSISEAMNMPLATVYSIVANDPSVVKCPHGKYRCIKCGTRTSSLTLRTPESEVAVSTGGFAEQVLREERRRTKD